jgi:hypothetical protein
MRLALLSLAGILGLGLLAAAAPASACEIILYRDFNMRGPSRHLFHSRNDLRQLHFNDQTSSIVVVNGTWDLFRNVGYHALATTVGPGAYPDVRAINLPNDSLSSLGCH